MVSQNFPVVFQNLLLQLVEKAVLYIYIHYKFNWKSFKIA